MHQLYKAVDTEITQNQVYDASKVNLRLDH